MGKVSRSEYSKAYYNSRKRRGVSLMSEVLTPELAKFIINKGDPKDFFEIYGNRLDYLVTTSGMPYKERNISFLVIRTKLGEVIGYSRFDREDRRVLKGVDLINREFTGEQITQLINNKVDIEILNTKGGTE